MESLENGGPTHIHSRGSFSAFKTEGLGPRKVSSTKQPCLVNGTENQLIYFFKKRLKTCLTTPNDPLENLMSLSQQVAQLVEYFPVIFKGNFSLSVWYIIRLKWVPDVYCCQDGSIWFWVHLELCVDCRHDDLKSMLDSSKDNLKLDAMKRIIGVSWGRLLSWDLLYMTPRLIESLYETQWM